MQCTSFLPGFYSSRDLNVGANGGAWNLYNNDRTLNNGHSRNVYLPLPTKDQIFFYDKEVMRQTILQHESIFREQVHELHRLYRRHRELMEEIKRRELSKKNVQLLQTSLSNSYMLKISSGSTQKMCQIPILPSVNPASSRLSISGVENVQSTLNFSEQNSKQASPDTAQTEDNSKDCKFLHSKRHNPKRKMFNLELPADEYIDSEEEDQLEEEKVSKVPEVPCYPTKRMQEVSHKSDLELFPSHGLLKTIFQGGSFSPDPFSRRTNDLADLNEPLWLEDAVAPNAVDLNMPPGCLLDSEVSQQNVGTEVLQAAEMPDFSKKLVEEGEDLSQKDLVVSQAVSMSVCDPEPKRFKTNDCTSNEQILGSLTDQNSENKEVKSNQEAGVLDIEMGTGKECTTTDNVLVNIRVDSMLSRAGNLIDLNCGINEGEASPPVSISRVITKTVAEIVLEAPVSPENKECTPPRGESEESPVETPTKLSKQEEDRYQEDELVRMAAEAIILISKPGFPKPVLENIVCKTLEASPNDSLLHWFAGVVSSLAGDLESEVGVALSGKVGSDRQELSSDESDYFETMTLELTEMEVEEYQCKNKGKKDETTGVVLSPSQPSIGRTRRGRQRKNFQTEVLPSLSSLSRHEVTKDLQTIGGLMEAAGFLRGTSPGRRNGCSRTRTRRRSGSSLCSGMENTACSPLKQQNDDSDFLFGERSLKGWGKMNRRRRGQRIPPSNPPVMFG